MSVCRKQQGVRGTARGPMGPEYPPRFPSVGQNPRPLALPVMAVPLKNSVVQGLFLLCWRNIAWLNRLLLHQQCTDCFEDVIIFWFVWLCQHFFKRLPWFAMQVCFITIVCFAQKRILPARLLIKCCTNEIPRLQLPRRQIGGSSSPSATV